MELHFLFNTKACLDCQGIDPRLVSSEAYYFQRSCLESFLSICTLFDVFCHSGENVPQCYDTICAGGAHYGIVLCSRVLDIPRKGPWVKEVLDSDHTSFTHLQRRKGVEIFVFCIVDIMPKKNTISCEKNIALADYLPDEGVRASCSHIETFLMVQ